jgi:hypothetical protein
MRIVCHAHTIDLYTVRACADEYTELEQYTNLRTVIVDISDLYTAVDEDLVLFPLPDSM